MITTKCKSCGTEKTFSDDKAGKKFKCPVCGEIVLIDAIKDDTIQEPPIIETSESEPTQTEHQKNSESEDLKKEFKDVGQEFKEVGKELGDAFKDVGKEFKKIFSWKK
jgi:uncharacterized Zn finger protein (UPF0148 family)